MNGLPGVNRLDRLHEFGAADGLENIASGTNGEGL